MLNAFGSSLDDTSMSVSADKLDCPVADKIAPPVDAEFSQPCPGVPELPHGHAAPLPSPKQNGVGAIVHERTNASANPFVSFGTTEPFVEMNVALDPSPVTE
jgi:hypothetical protein